MVSPIRRRRVWGPSTRMVGNHPRHARRYHLCHVHLQPRWYGLLPQLALSILFMVLPYPAISCLAVKMGRSHCIHDSSKVSEVGKVVHTAKLHTLMSLFFFSQRRCFGYHGGVLADIPIHNKQLNGSVGMPCFTVVRSMAVRATRI